MQAETTMNLLQTSRKKPRLSVYVQIFGTFDFNTTPIAPPGKKIIAHEKPNQCSTWSKHGVSVWYIISSMEHYMCYKVFVIETISERISDVMEFPPQNVMIPRVLSADADTLAAQDLVEALKKPTSNALFETINDTHHAALISLVWLFNIIPKSAETKSTNRHNGWCW